MTQSKKLNKLLDNYQRLIHTTVSAGEIKKTTEEMYNSFGPGQERKLRIVKGGLRLVK